MAIHFVVSCATFGDRLLVQRTIGNLRVEAAKLQPSEIETILPDVPPDERKRGSLRRSAFSL